jgi:hypothetical protein
MLFPILFHQEREMKKIAVLLLVLSLGILGCEKKQEKPVAAVDNAALLEIHDFKGSAVILDENTTVRKEPDDTLDNVVGTLQRDTKVSITKRKGKQSIIDATVLFWFEVSDGKVTGWVFGQSLSLNK